jgi:flagellar hook-length control protein FliK
MARTATAEGQHEKQSVSKVVGNAEAANPAAALAGPAQPASPAAQPTASQSKGTSGSGETTGQASGTHLLHGAGHLHPADANAGSKAAIAPVSQTGTTTADASATAGPAAATADESQARSDAVAPETDLAASDLASVGQTATGASTTQAKPAGAVGRADIENNQGETAPQKAPLTATDSIDSAGPVITTPASSQTPPDSPQASSTTSSGNVAAQDTSEVATSAALPTAPTNGSVSSNLRLHLPWLDRSGSSDAPIARAGEVHASATPLRQAAGQARPAGASSMQVGRPSGSTSTAGHLTLGGQSSAGTAQSTSLSQSNMSSAQGVSATSEASSAGATSSPFASAAPTAGAQALPFTYGANMQETIETIHATVALASRLGAAQAQISLEPAELGAVRIHLAQTSEGLVARVSAETVAGAQAIASGQSELQNTLSSLGVSLLRLDVGSFAQQQPQAGGQSPQGPHQQRTGSTHASAEAEEIASTSTVSLSPNSALIDVLA